jgi:phage terminase small subunit
MAKNLTPKQKRFADEYLVDLNATQASIRAGYNKKTARSIGAENLTKPDIQEYLQKCQSAREQRTEITQDRVIKELAAIGFANITNYAQVIRQDDSTLVEIVPTDELTEDQKSAVSSIKGTQFGIEIKLNDKIRALELLGKHLGVFDGKFTNPDNGLMAEYVRLLKKRDENA